MFERKTGGCQKTWKLLVLLFLFSAGGCRHAPERGLYLALRFTYYSDALNSVAHLLDSEKYNVVYPEMGVFDPDQRSFTDFAGSFEVCLEDASSGNEAMTACLLELPARLQDTFGAETQKLAWIFLNRKPHPGDDETLTPAAPLSASPTFDIHNEAHRHALIESARLLHKTGFDGIQLDLEPFPLEDVPAMVQLLLELRNALGPTFVRSVFVPKYVKSGVEDTNPGFVWSERAPYEELAGYCEQLVIPLYDFGPLAPDAETYQERVEELIRHLLPPLKRSRRLWFSIPAYRTTAQHGPAETIDGALEALRRARRSPAGLAVFVFTGEDVDFMPNAVRP